MTVADAILQMFPGAMSAADFGTRARSALLPLGFTPAHSLLNLVTCPDELCDTARQALRQGWFPPLDGAALGGVPLLGLAGFSAAASHAPVHDGRRRLVTIVLTHVGIGPEGQIGWCRRRGVGSPSTACGALAMLSRQLGAGSEPSPGNPDEVALGALWEALRPAVDPARQPDLWLLTQAALRQGMALSLRHSEAIAAAYDLDYAVLSGVTVHGVDQELVWPAEAAAVTEGRRQALALG